MLLQYFCSYICYLLPQSLAVIQNSLRSNKHGQKKNSVTAPEAVFAPGTAVSTGDANIQSDSHSASSPATSNNRLITCQTQEKTREEWAATVIQTAFRAFLVC